jgi:hypothetical protein
MDNENGPARTLADLYQSVTGGEPDAESLQRMLRIKDTLNLDNNDALWSVLAVLEYYTRLYDDIPAHIQEAGDHTLREFMRQAADAARTMTDQHNSALQECKTAIQFVEQLRQMHQQKYETALTSLSEDGLQTLVERASKAVSMTVGNRMVGTLHVMLRTHRDELASAREAFGQTVLNANARVDAAARRTIGRLTSTARWLVFGLPAAVVFTGVVMIGVQWWLAGQAVSDAHDELAALTHTKTDLERQIREARDSYAHFTAHTDGTFFVSGSDGTFVVSPGGFGTVTQCGAGLGKPCILIRPQQ